VTIEPGDKPATRELIVEEAHLRRWPDWAEQVGQKGVGALVTRKPVGAPQVRVAVLDLSRRRPQPTAAATTTKAPLERP
jgi:hypothetical protein